MRTCNAPPAQSLSIPALRYFDGLTSNFNGEFCLPPSLRDVQGAASLTVTLANRQGQHRLRP